MAIDVQEILMRIKVDTSEGINKLGYLEESYSRLIKAQKESKTYTESQSIADGMGIVKEKIDQEREALGLEGVTLKQLRILQREYAAGWQTTFTQGSPQWAEQRKNYDEVSAKIKEITRNQDAYDTQLKETVKTQGVEALSVKHLQEYYKLLKREIEDTSDFESAATKKSIEEAKKVDALIQHRTKEIKGTQSLMDQVFGQMPAALAGGIGGGIAAIGIESLQQIPQIVSGAIKSFAELSDVNSDLVVSLQISDNEVNALNQDLKKIDTRTSNKQLRELAIIAGDLNETDVTAFVESMDKASIVFQRDFSNVEELADTFGKMKGFFEDTKGQTMPEFINGIGSAIKKLNDDGPATTKGIIDFTTRVGSIPDVIKPAASDVLAFASVFEEAGMTAERSSSGLINVIQAAGENTGEFAKVLGMTRKEFKALYDQDPTAVIVKLTEKLKTASGSELIETLQKLKLTSKESVDVIGNMINNLDKFKDKQKLSSESVIEATRLQEVFNEKNTNAAAQIAKAGKVWDGWMASIGRGITSFIRPAIDIVASFSNETSKLNDNFFQQKRAVESTEGQIRPLLNRYAQLKPQIQGSAEKQAEFNDVLSKIGAIVPQAITEFDKYGRALKVNIGIVNEFLDKQKEALEKSKKTSIDARTQRIDFLKSEQANIVATLNRGTSITEQHNNSGLVTEKRLTDSQIRDFQNSLKKINEEITKSEVRIKELNTETEIKPTKPPETTKPVVFNSNLGDDKAKQKADKEERERIDRLKRIQTDTQKEIDIRAKLTYEADLALATEEQKQVLQAERHAEEQTTNVKRQYQDKNGLVKEYGQLTLREQKILADEETLIENEKNAKIQAIRKDFAQQREIQLKEQITRSLDMYLQARTQELNIQIEKAQSKGNDSRVFVLREQLLMENRQREANAEDTHYLEQKRKLKDNEAALQVLEKNHAQALLAIQDKYNNDSDKLLAEHTQNTIRRFQQDELERLRLQVSAKEQKGGDALQEKLALLNEEMRLALDVEGTTEQEKANIREHYRQQELGLADFHNKTTAQKIITGFSQAFQAVGQVLSTSLNNRTQQEQNSYDKSIQGLEKEHNAKILTDREYATKKKAIDEKHAIEERKLKKEQFELNRAEQLANAAINLASAIVKVLAEPWLIPLVSALGAVQIATILSTEAPAYAEGGFLSSKSNKIFDSGPGIMAMVGEKGDEYVTPNWQLRDPGAVNALEFLDYRRSNKITGIDSSSTSSQSPLARNSTGGNITIQNNNEKLIATLDKLSEKLDNLEAKVMFSHEHAYEISKLNSQNQQSQKSAFQ